MTRLYFWLINFCSFVSLGNVEAFLRLLLLDKTNSYCKQSFINFNKIQAAQRYQDLRHVSFLTSSSTLYSSTTSADSNNYTLSLKYSFEFPNPSYVQVLKQGFLSVTSFSLLKKGFISQYDLQLSNKSETPQIVSWFNSFVSYFNVTNNVKTKIIDHHALVPPSISKTNKLNGEYLWPNELTTFQDMNDNYMTIVPDGFLFPGQNDGGLYLIRDFHRSRPKHEIDDDNNSNNVRYYHKEENEPIRITNHKKGWFYHRAVYVRLPSIASTNGGVIKYREGILTARAYKSLFGKGKGELVWINLPSYSISLEDSYDEWEAWKETVLVEGPDVMFETVDIDPTDSTIEVISAHFFGSKITVHSLEAIAEKPYVKISDTYVLDNAVGKPYGLCLASMPSLLQSPVQLTKSASFSTDAELISSTVNDGSTYVLKPPISTLTSSSFDFLAPYLASSTVASPVHDMRSNGISKQKPSLLHGYSSSSSLTQLNSHSNSLTDTYIKKLSSPPPPPHTTNGWSTTSGNEKDDDIDSQDRKKKSDYLGETYSQLNSNTNSNSYTHLLVTTHECSYDLISTVKMAAFALLGQYPRIRPGTDVQREYSRRYASKVKDSDFDISSNVLLRALSNLLGGSTKARQLRMGGSLFAYELPRPRVRNTQATGTSSDDTVTRSRSWSNNNNNNNSIRRSLSSSSTPRLLKEQNITYSDVRIDSDSRILSWPRHTLCTGFKVKGWGGIFSPGAPGFPYVFYMPHQPADAMPLILLAGDCTGSAYIFTPRSNRYAHFATPTSATSVSESLGDSSSTDTDTDSENEIEVPTKIIVTDYTTDRDTDEQNSQISIKRMMNTTDIQMSSSENNAISNSNSQRKQSRTLSPVYDLAFEIECGATVGSAAATPATDGSNSVDIFVPSYELNQIHAFRLSFNSTIKSPNAGS